VAGISVQADSSRPDNYLKEVTVYVGVVGTNGVVNLGGTLSQVQEWRVFAIPQAGATGLQNTFSIQNLMTDQYWLARCPQPTGGIGSPIGTTSAGMNIYRLTFYVHPARFTFPGGTCAMVGVVPVFKGARTFSVQQVMSTNSVKAASHVQPELLLRHGG
jgi:hypothetical protein